MIQNCEECWYFEYDEELDTEICRMDLDQDELSRIYTDRKGNCPYFRGGGEYYLERHQ